MQRVVVFLLSWAIAGPAIAQTAGTLSGVQHLRLVERARAHVPLPASIGEATFSTSRTPRTR